MLLNEDIVAVIAAARKAPGRRVTVAVVLVVWLIATGNSAGSALSDALVGAAAGAVGLLIVTLIRPWRVVVSVTIDSVVVVEMSRFRARRAIRVQSRFECAATAIAAIVGKVSARQEFAIGAVQYTASGVAADVVRRMTTPSPATPAAEGEVSKRETIHGRQN